MVALGQALLYGGADGSGPLGDAWVLDIEAGKWVGLGVGCAKSWHSAEYLTTGQGRYVVVYGGESRSIQQATLDVQEQVRALPVHAPRLHVQAHCWCAP